uniref:Uncharacterized protein n=1 Tax=Arundo donax TaxID=35708 RepID=A0A0A9AZ48_ARUDO
MSRVPLLSQHSPLLQATSAMLAYRCSPPAGSASRDWVRPVQRPAGSCQCSPWARASRRCRRPGVLLPGRPSLAFTLEEQQIWQ